MYLSFHVKCPLFLSGFSKSWILSTDFSKISQISIFMKILAVGAEFLQADGRTERIDENNSHNSLFCEVAQNERCPYTRHEGIWVEVGLQLFLTTSQDGIEKWVSIPKSLQPLGKGPYIHWTGGWLSSTAGLLGMEKEMSVACSEHSCTSKDLCTFQLFGWPILK